MKNPQWRVLDPYRHADYVVDSQEEGVRLFNQIYECPQCRVLVESVATESGPKIKIAVAAGATAILIGTGAAPAVGAPAAASILSVAPAVAAAPVAAPAATGIAVKAIAFSGGLGGGLASKAVWDRLPPWMRGISIEDDLAATEYKDWERIGQHKNGFFLLVDFQKGNELVSLKSVDTSGRTWLTRMRSHIRALGDSGATINGQPATMKLDIRVQPGGMDAARSLVDFGKRYNVQVTIKEY